MTADSKTPDTESQYVFDVHTPGNPPAGEPDGKGYTAEELVKLAGGGTASRKNFLPNTNLPDWDELLGPPQAGKPLAGPLEQGRYSPTGPAWCWHWRPWPATVGFGLAAATILGFAFFMPNLLPVLMERAPGWYTCITFIALFGAGVCVMQAAPLYRPPDWTPKADLDQAPDHEYFRRKRGI